MPTYEYECAKCKKHFDAFQSMKDDAYTTCPKDKCCMKTWGRGKVKRLIGTGAGLIFKGSGFYITDYRSEGYKSAAKNDSAASSSAAVPSTPSSSSTKGEGSKPSSESSSKDSSKSKKSPPKQ
ncbi:MAG: FmdB family zinc ribbon protein [Verrucomicrobiota bacterium]|jgi:putative FmdB family regulatory protein